MPKNAARQEGRPVMAVYHVGVSRLTLFRIALPFQGEEAISCAGPLLVDP